MYSIEIEISKENKVFNRFTKKPGKKRENATDDLCEFDAKQQKWLPCIATEYSE